jgi:hypothetical protein
VKCTTGSWININTKYKKLDKTNGLSHGAVFIGLNKQNVFEIRGRRKQIQPGGFLVSK